jgi:hypothetical protein
VVIRYLFSFTGALRVEVEDHLIVADSDWIFALVEVAKEIDQMRLKLDTVVKKVEIRFERYII